MIYKTVKNIPFNAMGQNDNFYAIMHVTTLSNILLGKGEIENSVDDWIHTQFAKIISFLVISTRNPNCSSKILSVVLRCVGYTDNDVKIAHSI